MSDIKVRKLTIHSNDKGDLLKGFLKSENQNVDVNEVYISEIKSNHTKAWKKHNSMTSNLIVAYGEIKIVVLKDDESFESQILQSIPFVGQARGGLTAYDLLTNEDLGLLTNIATSPVRRKFDLLRRRVRGGDYSLAPKNSDGQGRADYMKNIKAY